MHRRTLIQFLATIPALMIARPLLAAAEFSPLKKTKQEWRKLLDSNRYQILFEERTEPPGTSAHDQEKRSGTFVCAACNLPLFASEHKYDSGTGWPSFTQPIPGATGTKRDFKMVWPRTEYHCVRCTGHQGHVFNDGPRPRGERWCNNGLALQFYPKGKDLPTLRS